MGLGVTITRQNLCPINRANYSDADIRFECTPCLDAISVPKNRVFDIKNGHVFCRLRNSTQVIYFQISGMLHFCGPPPTFGISPCIGLKTRKTTFGLIATKVAFHVTHAWRFYHRQALLMPWRPHASTLEFLD